MLKSSGKGIVVIGSQFGDEGKGKVVDYYASKPYIHHVVRFNGGSNAGHTIVAEGKIFALHALPSGLVFGKSSYIGNGMVLDLEQLDKEICSINQVKNMDHTSFLKISERVQLVLPIHIQMDNFQEEFKKGEASGSTKRGVGPSYSDKVNRIGIRFIDLWDEHELKSKLKLIFDYNSFILEIQEIETKIETLFNSLINFRNKYSKLLCDVGLELENNIKKGQNILFEGAQSTLLDIDHGIFPYNTSSTCVSAGASSGSGIGIQYLNERIGVVKAFTSRVGAGPVMGELDYNKNPGKLLQIEGKEFGTTTGRPRRIAWLDIVTLRYSCRINGFTGLAITKLDILGMLPNFHVITSYKNIETVEELYSGFPAQLSKYDKLKPIIKEFKGWGQHSRGKWLEMMEKGYQSFPETLKIFIDFIEHETSIPVYLIGLGPDRELTFEKKSLNWQ